MSKITEYGALTTPASNDVLPVVDVSDTTMASSGTTKKIAVSDLLAAAGGGAVASVNGHTGTVVLAASDVGADASGAASAAQAAAQAASLPLAGGTMSGAIAMGSHKVTGLTNGSSSQDAAAFGQLPSSGTPLPLTQGGTGLSEASNAALLAALGAAPLASPALTGSPTAPTQTAADGSTKIATTAYADAAVAAARKPWQFLPESYGAKGDGKVVGDAAMTTGTATLTSATAGFTSGDVGKNIIVNGALGSSNAPLYTTILSVTNSTTIVLNANATNTVSSSAAFWASDDSAAVVSAVNAASTYAQAGNWKAQVLFQAKSYGLATLTTTAAAGALAQQNALVPIPYPNVNGTTQKLIIELAGVAESADEQYFDSTIPSMTGTCLVATVAATGTTPSIIGGPSASTNLTGTWANVKPIIKGITVWAGFNPGWIGFDLHQCAACWVDNAAAQVFAPAGGGQNPGLGTVPTNSSGWGFIFPANNDNGAGRIMVEGYYQGVGVSPRTTIEKLFTQSNAIAVFARTVNSTVAHGARIGYWSCQTATTAIGSIGTSGTMPLVVDLFDSAGAITTDLSDPHGTIVGSMNWWHTVSTGPNVAAGFAMRINNLRLNPGPVASPPSAPSSGSPSTAIWRDTEVTLSLSGGSLTALLIDAVDQHIPSGCVLWKFTLPSGHTYTPTYTGTLSTDVAVM